MTQSALLKGPGRVNALCIYGGPLAPVDVQDLKRRAAELILLFEQTDLAGLSVLVALAPNLLEGHSGFTPETMSLASGAPFVNAAASVLVQIAAQTDVHRVYALRVVNEVFGPVMGSCQEVLGGRILNGQEPFGFSDGADPAAMKTRAESLPAAGSWLLYQRFRHNLAAFLAKQTAQDRFDVMGRPPMAIPNPGMTQEQTGAERRRLQQTAPHAQSHYGLMTDQAVTSSTSKLIRRGFPCRADGVEGLAFVGVAEHANVFAALLSRMASHGDRLLAFVEALSGGLYYCPPNAQWLDSSAQAFTPKTVQPLSRSQFLTSYDTTDAFLKYLMEMRDYGLFNDKYQPTRISDKARLAMDALYAALSDGNEALAAKLRADEENSFAQALTTNADYGEYITYG